MKFVYLKGNYPLIAGRLENRTDHFMSAELLQRQFDTLQEPEGNEEVIVVNVDQLPGEIVEEIRQ